MLAAVLVLVLACGVALGGGEGALAAAAVLTNATASSARGDGRCEVVGLSRGSPLDALVERQLRAVFADDSHVRVQSHTCSSGGAFRALSVATVWDQECQALPPEENILWLVSPQHRVDRECLLTPPTWAPQIFRLSPPSPSFPLLVEFVNAHCDTFRTPTGELSTTGQLLEEANRQLRAHIDSVVEEFGGDVGEQERCPVADYDQLLREAHGNVATHFLTEYVAKGRPLVIRGAQHSWPDLRHITLDYLKERFPDRLLTVYVSSRDGWFEGCEDASVWPSAGRGAKIPREVLNKLHYPDLVVVRPATTEMTVREFVDYLRRNDTRASYYVEYTSLANSFPELKQQFPVPDLGGMLEVASTNVWLSDGRTLGKLHFDPFDNLLCQRAGSKRVTLFDPNTNADLYEGHIREAFLRYNKSSDTLTRGWLGDSTSMVMSPVDIAAPDLERFPRFQKRLGRALTCTISEGDVLFLPSFWWHEVQSAPNTEGFNFALNYWFTPLFGKEFPCAECEQSFNLRTYRSLLPIVAHSHNPPKDEL